MVAIAIDHDDRRVGAGSKSRRVGDIQLPAELASVSRLPGLWQIFQRRAGVRVVWIDILQRGAVATVVRAVIERIARGRRRDWRRGTPSLRFASQAEAEESRGYCGDEPKAQGPGAVFFER